MISSLLISRGYTDRLITSPSFFHPFFYYSHSLLTCLYSQIALCEVRGTSRKRTSLLSFCGKTNPRPFFNLFFILSYLPLSALIYCFLSLKKRGSNWWVVFVAFPHGKVFVHYSNVILAAPNCLGAFS